jgi:hypothetical protein
MKAPKAFRATHLDDQTPFPESLQDIRSFLNLFKPMRQRGHGPDVGEERTWQVFRNDLRGKSKSGAQKHIGSQSVVFGRTHLSR